ncbi:hypothetical protein Tco_0605651 [Tanacetum coccineum]
MEALEEFKMVFGLVPSISKSTAYFCNVDCKVLVEKVQNRIGDWKNKFLSFARRLELCNSVLASMHIYWASVFILPKGIIHDIQQLIRGFLWCNGDLRKGKAKLIGRIYVFLNAKAVLSIWVKWIHAYKLKGRPFWDIPPKADISWGWRKLLQIRDLVKPHFWFRLVKHVWEAIRPRGNEVLWHRVIWFSYCIPRHAFHLWNNHIFKNERRKPKEIRDAIMVTVRLKLLTFRFKNTQMVNQLFTLWKMPNFFFVLMGLEGCSEVDIIILFVMCFGYGSDPIDLSVVI